MDQKVLDGSEIQNSLSNILTFLVFAYWLIFERDTSFRRTKRLSEKIVTNRFHLSEIGIQMHELDREALISLFRRFWSTVVFSGIHTDEDSVIYLRTIARFTPVLGGDAPNLAVDGNQQDKHMAQIRKSLKKVLGEEASILKEQEYGEGREKEVKSMLLYLHAIWTMEDFRVQTTHRSYPAFHYLADPVIMTIFQDKKC